MTCYRHIFQLGVSLPNKTHRSPIRFVFFVFIIAFIPHKIPDYRTLHFGFIICEFFSLNLDFLIGGKNYLNLHAVSGALDQSLVDPPEWYRLVFSQGRLANRPYWSCWIAMLFGYRLSKILITPKKSRFDFDSERFASFLLLSYLCTSVTMQTNTVIIASKLNGIDYGQRSVFFGTDLDKLTDATYFTFFFAFATAPSTDTAFNCSN